MPDGRFLITQKEGTMRIVTADGKAGSPITGIPAVNNSGRAVAGTQRLILHLRNNKMVYWVFSEKMNDGNLTSVARASFRQMNNALKMQR